MVAVIAHRILTGVFAILAILAITLAWINQNRYLETKNKLHDQDQQLSGIVAALDTQSKLDQELVATDRSTMTALTTLLGRPHAKTPIRTLATNR